MKRDIFLLCITLICLFGIGIAGYKYLTTTPTYSEEKTQATNPTTSSQLENNFIEIPAITFINEADANREQKYTYNVSYPAIALVGHANIAKETNTIIKTFAMDMLREFQQNASEGGVPSSSPSETSDFTMRSGALLLSPTIVSLRFDASEYIAGSAHPNQHVSILNYDMETHHVLSTEDLFASSSDGLPFLSSYTRKALKEKFIDVSDEEFASMVLPGTAPTHENFLSVGITKDKLVVIFNPYQVAPYARGSQEVYIPLDMVSSILSPRVSGAITLAQTNFSEAVPE